MTSPDPERIGIVGLGLLGGSVARGLRAAKSSARILASSLDAADLDRALSEGVIDEGTTDPCAVAEAASLLVYATPLDATLELLTAHRDVWSRDAVLTDVVSLKAPLARRMRELGASGAWIGGHPMAGSEQSGFEASSADLFREARVYLVRGEAGDGAAGTVERLWRSLGARPHWIDAEAHDRRMIWASHLPQLVASALASALDKVGVAPEELGPGGRDMTRLAGSSPDLWEALFRAAGTQESEAIGAIREELEALDRMVAALERSDGLGGADDGDPEDIRRLMERTRRWREGTP